MGLAQRVFERAGLVTVSVIHFPAMVAGIGVPRAVSIRFPLGRTFGPAGRTDLQLGILRDALAHVVQAKGPGEITKLPYRWRRS